MSLPVKRPYPYTERLPPQFVYLRELCWRALNNKKIIDFLWKHTYSDADFRIIIDAMTKLANIRLWLCEWREVSV
jgi:hypothetical protein